MCLLMMQWLHNKVVLDTTSVAAVLTSSNYFHQLCKSPVCGSLFERDFIEFLYRRSDQKKRTTLKMFSSLTHNATVTLSTKLWSCDQFKALNF